MAPPLPNSAHTETSSYLQNLAVPREKGGSNPAAHRSPQAAQNGTVPRGSCSRLKTTAERAGDRD